jgi:hypothetical protein
MTVEMWIDPHHPKFFGGYIPDGSGNKHGFELDEDQRQDAIYLVESMLQATDFLDGFRIDNVRYARVGPKGN